MFVGLNGTVQTPPISPVALETKASCLDAGFDAAPRAARGNVGNALGLGILDVRGPPRQAQYLDDG